MIEIAAGQHIYGNVEKSDSPLNIGGFQTLFYSKDQVSESEIEDIEGRLGYTFTDQNPEKLIFFQLGEKYVTTQITPLPEIDKFGRKGAYIAHSFIFYLKDIEKINYNPFVVFDLCQDKFVKTIADALALGKRGDVNVTPLKFSLDTERLNAFEKTMTDSLHDWNAQEIQKIVNFVLNEFQKKKGIKSVVISGSQSEIRTTIKGIFSLIPDIFRATCFFDTYFYNLNPVALKYPIFCYLTPPHSTQLVQVNTESKTVSNITIGVSSPYENWVFGDDYSYDLKGKCLFRNAALELDNYLSNKEFKKEIILENIKSPNTEIFLKVNLSLFQKKMDAFFKIEPTGDFAYYIVNAIKNNYKEKPKADLLEKVLTSFDKEEISNYLFDEIKGMKSPKKQEIDGLKTFLVENKHQLLQVIYSKWTGNNDSLLKILNSLSDNEYETAIELLLNEVDIKYLIVDSKFPIFIELFVKEALKKKIIREKTLDLVKTCLKQEKELFLSNLAAIIPKLTQEQMIAIQLYITEQKEDKQKLVPAEFSTVLAEHIEKTIEIEEIPKIAKKRDILKIVEKEDIGNTIEISEIPKEIEKEESPKTIDSENNKKNAKNKEQDIVSPRSNTFSIFKRKLKKE